MAAGGAIVQKHVSRLDDVSFWRPYVAEILERHDIADTGREPAAGIGATYPTFLYGDVVVKLFGYSLADRAKQLGSVRGCR
jgi:hygromycin-B 7''-O-kinase